ncbi:MAG: hypothetical protein KDA29_09980 [Phycisphaerales bacterium]|nr:hypothetical protein [Phycisphaerales bacterium]
MRTNTIFTQKNARIPLALALMGALGGISPMTALASEAGSELIVAQDGASYMTVDRADEPLRCGDQDVFYAIARLTKGTVLRTAGESGAYTKVIVPENIGALVPATEVELVNSGKVAKLRVDSKLRAPSQLMGLSGAWKQMYATALPAGTELEIIESLKNDTGGVVGYRVKAINSPSGELPIAYVLTDALRPALSSEIEAVTTGNTEMPKPANTTPTTQPEQPATQPTEQQTTQPVTQPEPETQDDEPAVDTSLLEEQVTNEPATIENQPPVTQPTQPVVTADEGRIPTSKLEDLEASFENARQLSRAELDEALSELLAEFTRTREEAEGDESLERALDQRIEWLKIRIQTRDQRRQISEALAEYDSNADQTAQAIEKWQQGRAYQLVGRMVVSSVYTGERLPLLYRVQGTDPITGQPRTVGYIAPKKDQDLRHMLGRVVGVLGVMRDDAALGLRVVEPERVDLMPE